MHAIETAGKGLSDILEEYVCFTCHMCQLSVYMYIADKHFTCYSGNAMYLQTKHIFVITGDV